MSCINSDLTLSLLASMAASVRGAEMMSRDYGGMSTAHGRGGLMHMLIV